MHENVVKILKLSGQSSLVKVRGLEGLDFGVFKMMLPLPKL